MHGTEKHMVFSGRSKYSCAKQWCCVKVKRGFHFQLGEAVGLSVKLRGPRQIVNRDGQREATSNDLPQLTAFQDECRAQAIVTIDHFLEAGAERTQIERSSQPETQVNVVSGTLTLKLVEKPQSLLRERSGIRLSGTGLQKQIGQQFSFLRGLDVEVLGPVKHGFRIPQPIHDCS